MNCRHLCQLSLLFLLFLLFVLPVNGLAATGTTKILKIASLAPAGSVWIAQFEKFAEQVSRDTGGTVKFRTYPGGVMGEDQAMYRKMRVGQLHGGGFTMTGIAAVVPDFRVLAVPFLFTSYAEVDHVLAGVLPSLKERFREKGLELVAVTEVGFLYAMSTKPVNSIESLRQTANWSPTGDPLSEVYLSTLGITPVQLTIPDVLSSLQSGLVETVYNSFYGSIVMQWFTKARYIVDYPYGYAYGAFALDRKTFAALSPKEQEAINTAASVHFPVLLADTRRSNEESRTVLAERGTTFQDIDPVSRNTLEQARDQAVDLLIPAELSRDIYQQASRLLEEYRHSAGTRQTGTNN
jgi:TRAP-type transport system periplasmic protein